MAAPDLVALASQMGETLLEIQQTLASFSSLTHSQVLDRIELQRDDAISALRAAYEKQTDALAAERRAARAARLDARRREDEERERRRKEEDRALKMQRAREDDVRALEFVDATQRIEESAEAEIRRVELQAQKAMDDTRQKLEELEGKRRDLDAQLTNHIRCSVPAMPQSRVKAVEPISEQDFAALMLETDELERIMAQNTPGFRVPFSAVSGVFDWLVEERHRAEEEGAVEMEAHESGDKREGEAENDESEEDEAEDEGESEDDEDEDEDEDEDGKETATPQDFLDFHPVLPTPTPTPALASKPKLALSIPMNTAYAPRKGPMTTIVEVPSAIDFPAFVQGHEHVDEAYQATTPIFIPPSAIYMPSVTEMVIDALGIVSPRTRKRSTVVSLSSESESVASTVLSVDEADQDTAPSTPGTVVGVQVLPAVIKRKPVPANPSLQAPSVVIAITEPTPVDQRPFLIPTPTEEKAAPVREEEDVVPKAASAVSEAIPEQESFSTSDTTPQATSLATDPQQSGPAVVEAHMSIALPATSGKDISAPISPYDVRSTTPPPDEPFFIAPRSPAIDRPPTPDMTPDGSPVGGAFVAAATPTHGAAAPPPQQQQQQSGTQNTARWSEEQRAILGSLTPEEGKSGVEVAPVQAPADDGAVAEPGVEAKTGAADSQPAKTEVSDSPPATAGAESTPATTTNPSPPPVQISTTAPPAPPAPQRPSPIHRISFTSLVAASSEPLPILSPRPRLSLLTSLDPPSRAPSPGPSVPPPSRAQTAPSYSSSSSSLSRAPDATVGVSSLFQRMRSIFETAPPNETPLAMTAAETSLVSPVVGRKEGRVPSGMFYPVVMRKVQAQTPADSDV